MALNPQILFGNVMHARLFPKKNAFKYGIYYIAIPLGDIGNLPIARNKFAPLSFYDADHGARDGSDLQSWIRDILKQKNLNDDIADINLICMPRVFGYVFNPVSFWICRDAQKNIRAILCEVNNTFGERHSYLCAHDDHNPIVKGDIIKGEKLFHVSPFLHREGHYEFQFDINDNHFDAAIDFYDDDNDKQLLTALKGDFKPMNKSHLRKAFWQYPLVTFKAIYLIHWQALRLVAKGIKYIPKPKQFDNKLSDATTLTKL